MLDESFKAKIAEDLEKSGFGSELRVRKIFKDHSDEDDMGYWSLEANTIFIDKDENKSREIDIKAIAERNLANSNNSSLYYTIIGEVKKSRHPWLVFKDQNYINGLASFIKYGTYNTSKIDILKIIHSTKTFIPNFLQYYGSGIHEAFKTPDQPSRWYSAFTSVFKAAIDAHEQDYKDELFEEQTDAISLSIYQPVVILDGSLLAVESNENNQIELESLMFISVPFEYATKNYFKEKQLIDIVAINHFEEYLKYTEGRIWDLIYRIYDTLEDNNSIKIPEDQRYTVVYKYPE